MRYQLNILIIKDKVITREEFLITEEEYFEMPVHRFVYPDNPGAVDLNSNMVRIWVTVSKD